MRYGVLPVSQDEYPLAVDKVRFVGDEVAAVAAVDEMTAAAALDLIRVDTRCCPRSLTLGRPWCGRMSRSTSTRGKPMLNGVCI